MRKIAIAFAAFAVIGIALPTMPSARAEDAKIVIGGDHDRDHERDMRRHHKKIVIVKHRHQRDHDHDHD